jgi:succinoglycan biosynthesis protein ExoH
MNSVVSNRIAMLRFLMIFVVVVLHTPLYIPIAEVDSNWFDLTKAFFQHAVFRASVPVLSVISGYLLFGSGLDRFPGKLFRKKFFSLVVPFLIFNLSLLAVAYVAQTEFGMAMSVDLTSDEIQTWLDAAFGLSSSPINYPLNFLRDLVALVLISPLLGWILRRAPWAGLPAVVVVFFWNLDGDLILREIMAVQFYVGGMAAVMNWDVLKLDKYALPLCALFLLACALMVDNRVADSTYLRLAAPLLIWPAAALLDNTTIGRWMAGMSRYSFFIFITHAPVLMATWIAYGKLGKVVSYEVYWVAAPLLTAALLVVIYRAANRLMPSAFNFMLGKQQATKRVLPADTAVPA